MSSLLINLASAFALAAATGLAASVIILYHIGVLV